MLIFEVLYEFFGVVMFLLFAKDTLQDESIKHMFVSDMNIFFHLPGLTLTIGTPIIVIGVTVGSPFILSFVGISAIGPVAGGTFAAMQGAGIAAGSWMAAAQSIVMIAATPTP